MVSSTAAPEVSGFSTAMTRNPVAANRPMGVRSGPVKKVLVNVFHRHYPR